MFDAARGVARRSGEPMGRAPVSRSPEVTELNVRTTLALGACAAQTLFVKPGLVADLHIVAVGIEHIGSVIAGIELRPQS
jgi:hypothetical protein